MASTDLRSTAARDERGNDGGRSERLREFSAHLAARLQASPGPLRAPARLAVRIGGDGYLLDMNQAGEIVTVPGITAVPWTKPWFRGLANVRGRLVGVIDLPLLAGGEAIGADDARQLVVGKETLKFNIALLVTRAFGLRNLAELDALGAVDDKARPWERGAYRDGDGNRLVEIDLARLVAVEDFANIGT